MAYIRTETKLYDLKGYTEDKSLAENSEVRVFRKGNKEPVTVPKDAEEYSNIEGLIQVGDVVKTTQERMFEVKVVAMLPPDLTSYPKGTRVFTDAFKEGWTADYIDSVYIPVKNGYLKVMERRRGKLVLCKDM